MGEALTKKLCQSRALIRMRIGIVSGFPMYNTRRMGERLDAHIERIVRINQVLKKQQLNNLVYVSP